MISFQEFKQQRIEELQVEDIRGNIRHEHSTGLQDLWNAFGDTPPQSMIEIGCFIGVSTEFWLLHCASVIAVDPWEEYGLERHPFDKFVARCGKYPNLRICRGRSPLALLKLPKVDFIYIDGDHSEHAVRSDIEASLWRTNRPGWIGGHDYDIDTVKRVVDDFVIDNGSLNNKSFMDSSWLVELK